MIIPNMNASGDSNFEFKMISFALVMLFLVPTFFLLFVPAHMEEGTDWGEEIESLENTYYAQTGSHSTTEQNVWTLTGIYTPYAGLNYGYTEDGWIYGTQVKSYTPLQYTSSEGFTGTLEVAQAPNGLWYYISVPDKLTGITCLTTDQYSRDSAGRITINDTKGATVYSAVYFDEEFTSDVFFTTSSKVTTDRGYYYEYSGYRYTFQPLSDYFTTVNGETKEVTARNSSLSLIWYKYAAGTSGIAGQLAISGSDKGVSYLTADDIVRVFNSTNYSSTFDMTFNSVQMHLAIRLDPARLASGMSIRDCYDNGYWSVVVYSDAILNSMGSTTYEFSVENILETVISLFTFQIADEYDIDGWLGVFASMMVTMPLYIALVVIALNHSYLWILIALVAAIQAVVSFGSSFWNIL